ncbi:hypothetical protein WA026_007111 [Henosepilachna vigintioctopunctata]|uniref:Uncharacterized protein n=1 Tax=Henosepilachna vigintioctopunctata TaxID=420089 RepID=A0AAW1VCI4_9CUCU
MLRILTCFLTNHRQKSYIVLRPAIAERHAPTLCRKLAEYAAVKCTRTHSKFVTARFSWLTNEYLLNTERDATLNRRRPLKLAGQAQPPQSIARPPRCGAGKLCCCDFFRLSFDNGVSL